MRVPESRTDGHRIKPGAFAEKAEALGYDTVWFSDHIVIPTEVKSFYPYDPSGTNGL